MSDVAGPKQLRRLLDAVLTIGSELDLPTTLRRIIEAATDLVDAEFGALGVLDDAQTHLAEFITVGIDAAGRAAIGDLPHGHGILGLLIVEPKPLRLPDLHEHPDSYGFPPHHPPMTSFLGVPIRVRDAVFGNLYLCDKTDGDVFSDVDEEMVVALAGAAAVAIDNARLHARVAELALSEDRERIARDLHDHVIQRLFATGLSLQATLGLAADRPELASRLHQAVDDLDETVREVRSAIFELHTARLPGRSIRRDVVDLAAESASTLGFEPTVRFAGAVDAAVGDALADDLLAVTREALANVARHAAASRAEVRLTAATGVLVLEVIDDGKGPGAQHAGGHGLDNMKARAAKLGGSVSLAPGERGGAVLRWQAPITD